MFTHIDRLSELIRGTSSKRAGGTPPPQVLGVADAGYFMDLPSITGQYQLRELFQKVVNLHQSGRFSILNMCIAVMYLKSLTVSHFMYSA